MATSNRTQAFKIRTPLQPAFALEWIVASGSVQSIAAGDPVTLADATGAATGAVKIAGDGDPIVGSGHRFAGIAKSDSTDTATVAGIVQVWLPLPGIIYSGKAKTSSTADTQAEINALQGKRVVLDLTSTTWSVDAAATDAITNGIVIVGGNPPTTEIYFMVMPSITFLGNAVA